MTTKMLKMTLNHGLNIFRVHLNEAKLKVGPISKIQKLQKALSSCSPPIFGTGIL